MTTPEHIRCQDGCELTLPLFNAMSARFVDATVDKLGTDEDEVFSIGQELLSKYAKYKPIESFFSYSCFRDCFEGSVSLEMEARGMRPEALLKSHEHKDRDPPLLYAILRDELGGDDLDKAFKLYGYNAKEGIDLPWWVAVLALAGGAAAIVYGIMMGVNAGLETQSLIMGLDPSHPNSI